MPIRQQILVVDDDAEFTRALCEHLDDSGDYVATAAGSIAEAEAMRAEHATGFAACLLDVTLPDGDGRQFCARLRGMGVGMPILMLTGSDSEDDIVHGLSCGADDYIAKPLRPAVLMARLRSQLRGAENGPHVAIGIGPYTFHPAEKLLRDPERRRRIRLTDKETRLLRHLCRTPGTPVARRTLLGEVWGYSSVIATHTLETHIYRLRQKIERDPRQPSLIVSGEGCYALNTAAA